MTALLSAILRLIATAAHATSLDQLGCGTGGSDPSVCRMWQILRGTFPAIPEGGGGFESVLYLFSQVATFILHLIGGAAIAVLIYAGIKLTTSAGEPSRLEDAKKIALHAIVGLILALLADVIVLYACNVIIPMVTGGFLGQCPIW
ncbi:hypothetical protein HY285_01750 [Candidatus Peregrinibacteria bacterium]|nr:hypothetical protein [Candidatus Peregrinibacteria bacterium]